MLHIICNTIAWLLLLSLSNVTAGWDYWLLFFASSMHLSDKIINYSYWYNNLLTRLIDFIHIPQIYQLLNSQNAFLFLCVCVVFETWSYVSSVDPRLPLYPRLRSSSSCLHFLSAEYTPVLPHLLRMILSALYQLSIFKKKYFNKVIYEYEDILVIFMQYCLLSCSSVSHWNLFLPSKFPLNFTSLFVTFWV